MATPPVTFQAANAYGPLTATVTMDPISGISAGQVDTQDGFPVLHPALTAAGGGPVQLIVDPSAVPPSPAFWQAMPELNAVLIELRVISALLREQMGDTKFSFDLQSLRADEAWNTSPVTGAL